MESVISRIESLGEALQHLHRRENPKPKPPKSLEEVLANVDRKRESGELLELDGGKKGDWKMRLIRNGLKVDRALTGDLRTRIQKLSVNLLSEDETSEAMARFKGAGYFYRLGSFALHTDYGYQFVGKIQIQKNLYGSYSRGWPELIRWHEPSHEIHFFLRMKQLEAGNLQDPLLKKLHGYVHGKRQNEFVWGYEGEPAKHYHEGIASAMTINAMGRKAYEAAESDPGRDALALAALLAENPKAFRILMESPSLWIDARHRRFGQDKPITEFIDWGSRSG